jgi:hypothetical protein
MPPPFKVNKKDQKIQIHPTLTPIINELYNQRSTQKNIYTIPKHIRQQIRSLIRNHQITSRKYKPLKNQRQTGPAQNTHHIVFLQKFNHSHTHYLTHVQTNQNINLSTRHHSRKDIS